MYNIAIIIYGFVMRVAALFNSKAKKMIDGHKQIFALLQTKIDKNEKYIWVHAASLGEFEQGRPLIESIRKLHPQYKILLTFFSPSGYEVRKDYKNADVVCYLPFDTKKNAQAFLDAANPAIAIFIKYEFWLNYLNALHKRAIPTYIVSTIFRPNQIFFRWYGEVFRQVLPYFKKIFVQNETSKQLLAAIGVTENIVVSGDTRFDRVLDIKNRVKELPLIEQFAANKKSLLLVAGSTWEEDEDLIISYFNNHPNMKLILAPHEINDSHLQSITEKLKRPFIYYSLANESNVKETDCILIDGFGILSSSYRYGDIAYVGGGFGSGIHNILEAAVYDIPVIFGPNYTKFNEAKEMVRIGGAFPVKSNQDFVNRIDTFTHDNGELQVAGKIAGEYVASLSGATQIVMNNIQFQPE